MITEAPEWKLKPQTTTTSKDKLGGLNLAPSPSTSIGTQFANSPNWSPLSVQEDGLQKQQQKFQAKSRIETILEKAKQQNIGQSSSCDVVETAQKLGIQCWLLSKTLGWVDLFKRRTGFVETPKRAPLSIKSAHQLNQSHRRAYSSSENRENLSTDVRELKIPYLKFEVTNHEYRPVFSEFRRFPKLFFGGRAGQSPFFPPETLVSRQVRTNTVDPVAKAAKAYEARKTVKQPQPQNGYCEICECPFSELEEHLNSKVHQTRVGLTNLWSKLDTCISEVNRVSDEDYSDDSEVQVATSDQ